MIYQVLRRSYFPPLVIEGWGYELVSLVVPSPSLSLSAQIINGGTRLSCSQICSVELLRRQHNGYSCNEATFSGSFGGMLRTRSGYKQVVQSVYPV